MNILDTLNKKQKERLIYKSYTKDQIIFKEDEKCQKIGIVLNGNLAIISFLYNGDEIIYNTLKKDNIFGNNLIFSSDPYYKGNVLCLSDTEVALIDKEDLIYFLKNNEDFLKEYLAIQSDFGKKLNSRIKLLSFDKASDRLLYFLKEHDGIYKYDSISNLAIELNLKRESLSRTISKLIKNKDIIKQDKTLKVL